MPRAVAQTGLAEDLTVKAAAEFLGVCPSTLRNWDWAGKFKTRRHPMNCYRLYRRDELEAALRSVQEGQQGNG